jgi:putative endonuclease
LFWENWAKPKPSSICNESVTGWDGDTLCFVEAKTRTDVSFAPPSAAVTRSKQAHVLAVARRYLRHLSVKPACRFDILSIVPSAEEGLPEFTLRKGAFGWRTANSRDAEV